MSRELALEWMYLAEDDLLSAEEILSNKRLTNIVCFPLSNVLKKLLKLF